MTSVSAALEGHPSRLLVFPQPRQVQQAWLVLIPGGRWHYRACLLVDTVSPFPAEALSTHLLHITVWNQMWGLLFHQPASRSCPQNGYDDHGAKKRPPSNIQCRLWSPATPITASIKELRVSTHWGRTRHSHPEQTSYREHQTHTGNLGMLQPKNSHSRIH